MALPLADLTKLLGKDLEDPGVKKLLAKVGKVTIKPDFIIAKESGFDFALDRPKGAKKKILSTLFLYAEGADKHRAFTGLPSPFAFGIARSALLAAAGPPAESWTMGKGKVAVDAKKVDRDTWQVAGAELAAKYRDGVVHAFFAHRSEAEEGGRDLATHPLHFEAAPVDAPANAELVGMGLLVAWAADRFGLPAKHATTPLGKQLAKRAITPVAFLEGACGKTLTTLDVQAKLGEFLWGYTHRLFGDDDEERVATDRTIKKWLNLHRADERSYNDDFLGTFAGAVKSPYHVPDSWDAVERIAPILDARWADFEATSFATAPDLKLYEKAAKLRDARKVEPATSTVAVKGSVDDALATDLVQLIGRPLSDKAVQAVLARTGLPIGKKTDEQANPALGVSYLAAKVDVAGKRVLGFASVRFHAAKQTSHIRGLGKEVEFAGYPGPLPLGVRLGAARAAVRAAFGDPKFTVDDTDYWCPRVDRAITATFGKNGTLVRVTFLDPDSWSKPPEPPFGPAGIF
jgi:hypothetical protein